MPEQPIDTEESLLISYLDGEVDGETRRQLETRLALEPELRKRLQALEESWQALDLLELAPLDKDLVKTTMELLAVDAEKELGKLKIENPPSKRLAWLQFSAGMSLAAACVFSVVTYITPNPNRQLLEDLPLLERLDEYRSGRNFEFLQELDHSGLFKQEETTGVDKKESENLSDRG